MTRPEVGEGIRGDEIDARRPLAKKRGIEVQPLLCFT